MPTARQILDLLTRDELLRLVDHHGVTVADRRQKALLAAGLEQQGHGPEFWATLGRMMPDYEERRRRLREIGPGLEW